MAEAREKFGRGGNTCVAIGVESIAASVFRQHGYAQFAGIAFDLVEIGTFDGRGGIWIADIAAMGAIKHGGAIAH